MKRLSLIQPEVIDITLGNEFPEELKKNVFGDGKPYKEFQVDVVRRLESEKTEISIILQSVKDNLGRYFDGTNKDLENSVNYYKKRFNELIEEMCIDWGIHKTKVLIEYD